MDFGYVRDYYGGGGGGGGYTSYKNGIAVSPGQQITITVGAGGLAEYSVGEPSSATFGNMVLVSAKGGLSGGPKIVAYNAGDGGSAGGYGSTESIEPPHDGWSDGNPSPNGSNRYVGQGSTTKEFGTGTLYSGGGGGGVYVSNAGTNRQEGGYGGSGGGGKGAGYNTDSAPGSFGTGGGGGGGKYDNRWGSKGGSGNVIVTW